MLRLTLLDTIWQQQPMELEPFLPADNDPAVTAPEYAWLRHANEELGELLRWRFPRFASHVLSDPKLRCFLDNFLRYRRRYFDRSSSMALLRPSKTEPAEQGDEPDDPLLVSLDRRVFMVYLRLFQRIEDGGEYAMLRSDAKSDGQAGDGRSGDGLVKDLDGRAIRCAAP